MLGVLNAATQGNSPVYELYSVTLRNAVTGKVDDCAEGVGAGLGARPYADGDHRSSDWRNRHEADRPPGPRIDRTEWLRARGELVG